MSVNTFLFHAFHGGYTGGVCVVQAKTREEAIEHVIQKFGDQLKEQKIHQRIRKEIDQAYYAVFPEKKFYFDKSETSETAVTAKIAVEFENPTQDWQRVWNSCLPFPEEDPFIQGRVIQKKLYDSLPDFENHIAFGTWTEGGMIEEDEEEADKPCKDCTCEWEHTHQLCDPLGTNFTAHDKAFLREVRKELESCTFKNGNCVRLYEGFVVLQGGGT